jgi:hypothetical protein
MMYWNEIKSMTKMVKETLIANDTKSSIEDKKSPAHHQLALGVAIWNGPVAKAKFGCFVN